MTLARWINASTWNDVSASPSPTAARRPALSWGGAEGLNARHGQRGLVPRWPRRDGSAAGEGKSVANELKYGDKVHLQNGYNSWRAVTWTPTATAATAGRSTRCRRRTRPRVERAREPGRSSPPPARPSVPTSSAGTWSTCATCTAGTAATSTPTGTRPPTRRTAAASTTSPRPRTRTAPPAPAAGGFSPRRPLPVTSTSAPATSIHLWNTYDDNGGFLETNGGGPGGGKYDVCTNAYYNRGPERRRLENPQGSCLTSPTPRPGLTPPGAGRQCRGDGVPLAPGAPRRRAAEAQGSARTAPTAPCWSTSRHRSLGSFCDSLLAQVRPSDTGAVAVIALRTPPAAQE